MSSVSFAQKTKTVSKTAMSQEQSTKLLHTTLMMSFGCVAFLRGLFTDENFVDQRFCPRKFEKDYDPEDPAMKVDSIRVKTLARGKSAQVDMFLDWIDHGVLDAIQKNYLKGLVLAIFLDESKPGELHEAYTFSFCYTDGKVKLEVNNSEPETVSLLNARQAIQHLMRRFIIITQGLNNLPEKKFVTMRMLFNDSCPKNYQPEGFRDAASEPIAMIKTKKSTFESYSAGVVSIGCHEVQLKVISSAADDNDTTDEQIIQVDPLELPQQMNGELKLKESGPVTARLRIATMNSISTQLEPSQTTKILRGFLQDDSTKTQSNPTQAIRRFGCECGCQAYIQGHSFQSVSCATCGSSVHRICYGLQLKETLPACLTCRVKCLGDLPLHDNLRVLLLLRVWIHLARNLKSGFSLYSVHQLLGLADEEIPLTAQVISFMLKSRILINLNEHELDPLVERVRDFALNVGVDIDGILNNGRTVRKRNYPWCFGSPLHCINGTRGSVLSSYFQEFRNWKVFICEKTKGKGLCTDEELDKISWDDSVSRVANLPFSYSEIYEEYNDVVNCQFPHMDIESSQEGISSSSQLLFQGKSKRRRDSTESVDDDSVPEEMNFYTSNPVTMSPKWKKRKMGVSTSILDSTMVE